MSVRKRIWKTAPAPVTFDFQALASKTRQVRKAGPNAVIAFVLRSDLKMHPSFNHEVNGGFERVCDNQGKTLCHIGSMKMVEAITGMTRTDSPFSIPIPRAVSSAPARHSQERRLPSCRYCRPVSRV
jgi:hypothetical protein